METLFTSKDVMTLLKIKSHTTLIKYERIGKIKVAKRIGNQKRYTFKHLQQLLSE